MSAHRNFLLRIIRRFEPRLDLKEPPTAVGGIPQGSVANRTGRPDLNESTHYRGRYLELLRQEIDPKLLDTYAGQYQAASSSSVLTVTREGDKLMAQQGANPEKRQLLPESATDFFMRESPRQTFSFIKDETGQAYLVIKIEGQEVGRAKKIK